MSGTYTGAHKKYQQSEKGRVVNQRKCANYRKTEGYKQAQARYRAKRYSTKAARIQRKGRSLTQYAVDRGILIRPDYCMECRKVCKPYAHHDDYTKPLEIRWLCQACDRVAHQEAISGDASPV